MFHGADPLQPGCSQWAALCCWAIESHRRSLMLIFSNWSILCQKNHRIGSAGSTNRHWHRCSPDTAWPCDRSKFHSLLAEINGGDCRSRELVVDRGTHRPLQSRRQSGRHAKQTRSMTATLYCVLRWSITRSTAITSPSDELSAAAH